MKLISALLSICLTFNVLAASGTATELERQLDEYQYVMTVEWDQKDQAFYERETKAFFEKLSKALSEGSASKESILALAESKMKNKEALNALKFKLSLLTNVNSQEQLAQALKESSKDFYGKGASWSGDVEIILAAAGIIAVIGYIIWFSKTHECVAWEQRWECRTTNDEYSSYTTCGWEDYCIDYSRK